MSAHVSFCFREPSSKADLDGTQFARTRLEVTMKSFALAFSVTVFSLGSVTAQELQRFSFDIGGGFSQPVGNTGRKLDEGWNIRGGAGFNFSQYVGAMIQLDYNRFGINGTTLDRPGFPDGNVGV